MPSGLDQLRDATRDSHRKLELHPYAVSVLDGSVSVRAYAGFLRAARVLHDSFEPLLERASDERLRRLSAVVTPRLAGLDRDLAFLGEAPGLVDAVALRAELFAQRLRWFSTRDPLCLLGVAYVLEGSNLGGVVQASKLLRRPEFREGGLAYLRGSGSDTQRNFGAFMSVLDEVLSASDAVQSAIAGAQATFDAFESVFDELVPSRPNVDTPLALLNPDAGTHELPADLREVRAAFLAGESSWQRRRYYAARFGERGARFTRSDSAWLAWIARSEPEPALREISWLARVLAHRGMPRFLLEEHLQTLHSELARAVPERAAEYDSLQFAAEALKRERCARVSVADFERIAGELEAALPSELRSVLGGSGVLPVAAVADEACGISGAVSSLEPWLSDAERFPLSWVSAVQRAFAQARQAVVRD